MIECKKCETAQFLQITESRMHFKNGESIKQLEEKYQCTLCGSTGEMRLDTDKEDMEVNGDVEDVKREPMI